MHESFARAKIWNQLWRGHLGYIKVLRAISSEEGQGCTQEIIWFSLFVPNRFTSHIYEGQIAENVSCQINWTIAFTECDLLLSKTVLQV